MLANLHRAMRQRSHLYLTVEEQDQEDVEAAYAKLVASGLPAVRGEVVEGHVAGYHSYPHRRQVLAWLDSETLELIDEHYKNEDGRGYRHFLLRSH